MSSGSKFIRQVLSIMACVAVSLAQEQGLHLHLVPSMDQSCFNKVISLTCNHPDMSSPEFLDSSPNWTEDGRIVTPTGSMFSSMIISPTKSVLNVTISPTHFQHHGHNYTCFLRTREGRTSSNSVTVDPLRTPLKPSIEAVDLGSSNVSVVWTQNRICFSKCDFRYKLTLFNSTGFVQYSMMTTQQSAHISGLLPGIHYTLELVGMCEEYTSSATIYIFSSLHTGEHVLENTVVLNGNDSNTIPSDVPRDHQIQLIVGICVTGGITGCCALSVSFGGVVCCVHRYVKTKHRYDNGSKDASSKNSSEDISADVERIAMQDNPCYVSIEMTA